MTYAIKEIKETITPLGFILMDERLLPSRYKDLIVAGDATMKLILRMPRGITYELVALDENGKEI